MEPDAFRADVELSVTCDAFSPREPGGPWISIIVISIHIVLIPLLFLLLLVYTGIKTILAVSI